MSALKMAETIKRSPYAADDAEGPIEERGAGFDSSSSNPEKESIRGHGTGSDTKDGAVLGAETSPLGEDLPSYDERREGDVVHTAEDLVTRIIDLEDDPTQNPWTFRVLFLGKLRGPTILPVDEPHHA
jgi:hypothetical protein